jgi:hypothetical protein
MNAARIIPAASNAFNGAGYIVISPLQWAADEHMTLKLPIGMIKNSLYTEGRYYLVCIFQITHAVA